MRKETYAAEQFQRVKARKQRLRERFAEYKASLSCEVCGFSHPAALDFHHRDGDDKQVEVAKMITWGNSWETIMAEVAKCQVLCANCHRILHYDASRRGANGQRSRPRT